MIIFKRWRIKGEPLKHLSLIFSSNAQKGKFLYSAVSRLKAFLHFTSLRDLFTQTPSRLLWEASSHVPQLMREGCSYTYPPLSIARYSFIQLSELNCRVKKLAQGFNNAAQDSNPGSRSREFEALPLSHCALALFPLYVCSSPLLITCSYHYSSFLIIVLDKVISLSNTANTRA